MVMFRYCVCSVSVLAQLASLALMSATHGAESIVQCLCLRKKKKKKMFCFVFSSQFVFLCARSPTLVWWYRLCSHKPNKLFVKQKIKDPCSHSNTFLIYWFLPLQSSHRMAFVTDPIRFAQPIFMAFDLTCPKVPMSWIQVLNTRILLENNSVCEYTWEN